MSGSTIGGTDRKIFNAVFVVMLLLLAASAASDAVETAIEWTLGATLAIGALALAVREIGERWRDHQALYGPVEVDPEVLAGNRRRELAAAGPRALGGPRRVEHRGR